MQIVSQHTDKTLSCYLVFGCLVFVNTHVRHFPGGHYTNSIGLKD